MCIRDSAEAERGANRVHVGIDQARDHGPALKIDQARLPSRQFLKVRGWASGDDAAVADRHGLSLIHI